jgi:hypothetical protein
VARSRRERAGRRKPSDGCSSRVNNAPLQARAPTQASALAACDRERSCSVGVINASLLDAEDVTWWLHGCTDRCRRSLHVAYPSHVEHARRSSPRLVLSRKNASDGGVTQVRFVHT